MLRKILMAVFVMMLPVIALGQVSEAGKPVKQVFDADIVGSVTWSNDTVYVMNGFLYVENGESLTIESGTIIKGKPGSGAAATALVVARGGTINANGSATDPIIFTAEADNVDLPNDLPLGAASRGLWGSVIILGEARLNTAAGTAQIEGIPDTEPRGNYGGTDDNDNSGIFRYVSLRHGGSIIGANNEINGLTMGGVGRGTQIDHVEAFQNLDDGFEFFGGTVNTKYLAAIFCDDDGFDTDFGFTGSGQYWFNIKDSILPSSGSRAFEWDGCTSPATPATPAILTKPFVSNVTAIGSGATSGETDNDYAMSLRSGTGGIIYNSIFTDFAGKAVQSATAATDALLGTNLKLINNVFYGFKNFTVTDSLVVSASAASFITHLNTNDDMFVNPGIREISRTTSGDLDPRPMGLAAAGGIAVPGADDPQSWLDDVAYQGAFEPTGGTWMCDWTATDFYGILAPCSEMAACDCITDNSKPVRVFTDADMVGQIVWRNDTVYNLSGFVFIENNEVLTIEPGTVIKGNPGSGAGATAMIVARGGKIYAEGTPNCPIIFTSLADDVDFDTDIPLGAAGRGLWGSVIILGKARLNTAAGTAQIEGIPDTEPRGAYGGTDDDDNSGVFSYVSLRHGGSIIGANNEINGLTMGGVGRGTQIDHVEAYQNLDDGFEFFGGTVNTKYLVAAFCDDDGFDTDFGFSGSGQYWFNIKDSILPSSGSRAFEWDGCTSPATPATPAILTKPFVSNVTAIGSGASSGETDNDYAMALRSGTGGVIYNSIFTDFAGKAIQSATATSDGLLGTDLKLVNNAFWGFKSFAITDSLIVPGNVANKPAWVSALNAGNDMFVNPNLRGISRDQSAKLDPRPSTAYSAATGGIAVPGADDPQGWLDDVAYQGAFDPNVSMANSWMGGWTFLWCGGHIGDQADRTACACTDNGKPTKVFADANMAGNYVMSKDTIYNLNGFVYVENGEVLRIEPGTVLKGNPGSGAGATAMVVARGGKIFAEGTADCPIIFTSVADDIDLTNDIPLGSAGRGLWGSLIVLGNARLNTAAGTAQIEGIPDTEPRGNYGGTNDDDNSGIVRYVSLRHGGSIIGANNEINGLTMGGVGRGTQIDHVEAYQNLDDGFEFFGGTVNTKYLVTAFCDDDGFDTDFGFTGSGQYWFVIKDSILPSSGSRAFEWDGCTSPATPATPAILTKPYVSNVTAIGSGAASGETDNDYAVALRSGTGGIIYNSIFTDFAGKAIQSATTATDGLLGTNLKFTENIFYGFKNFTVTDSLVASSALASFVTHLNTNNEMLLNPFIRGISRDQSGKLDPRPCATGIGASGSAVIPVGDDPQAWLDDVTYRGAFDPNVTLAGSWLGGCWSFLTAGNHLGEVAAPVNCSPVVSCCVGTTGNVNDGLAESPDLSDLSLLIAYLTQTPKPVLPCPAEANVNGSVAINPDLSDLSLLIAYLTQTPKPVLPNCPL